MVLRRAEPQVLELLGDLDIASGPAEALLPERVDAAGLLCPDHGMGLEDDLASIELGLEGGEGVLGQRGGVDLAADGLDVEPGVELGAASQAGEHPEDVLAAPGRRLRGDVLVADEPGHVVART